MIFRVKSFSYKQNSFKSLRYFPASLNKGRKSACSFVTSTMMGYKNKTFTIKCIIVPSATRLERPRDQKKRRLWGRECIKCENVLENRTEAVIGLFHERNVVRMRAAIRTFGERCVTPKKRLRKETSEQKTTEWINRASNAIASSKVLHSINWQ